MYKISKNVSKDQRSEYYEASKVYAIIECLLDIVHTQEKRIIELEKNLQKR